MTYPSKQKLVVIGPLPPPFAGTSVSFSLFCEYLTLNPDKYHLEVINSAPKELGRRSLFNVDNLFTASRILGQLLLKAGKADKVLLFGNDQFLISIMPVCLCIAKVMRTPFHVRVFGGSLDAYYLGLSPALRRYFHWVIGHTDGLIFQTRALRHFFYKHFGEKIHYVPGYRLMQKGCDSVPSRRGDSTNMKFVYVGHIREEKGIFVLLESFRLLAAEKAAAVECDLFGPVYPEIKERFEKELANCPGVNYRGVLQPEDVVATIRRYDAFVFPSFYRGEGHPGVLIEAMMSGLPIVTTEHKAIPELISHRVNGLLVPPRDPSALAVAIRLLIDDSELLAKLAEQSYKMSSQYSSREVIPIILSTIGFDVNERTIQA